MFPSLGICIIISSVASSSLVQREAQISHSRILPASFILPSAIAPTILPENTLPSASVSILPTSPFNVSSNVINLPNTTAREVKCYSEYAQGLTVASCLQAQSQLMSWLNGLPRSKITIGQQGDGVWDINDRIKFLSRACTQKLCGFCITDEREAVDRVCAFDIGVEPGQEDRMTRYDLSYAAASVMRECVAMAGSVQAGFVRNIGVEAEVYMEAQYEEPLSNLECLVYPPAGPPMASCFALRNSMPKAGDEQTFGRIGANVDVVLPYTLVREDGRCTLTIDTTGPDDSLAWYTIYKAATEIEVSCVRQGQRGMINGLGTDRNLFVMLSDSGPVNYSSSF